jgi:2-iminobutanoate/2-iminopropanoate deaminase
MSSAKWSLIASLVFAHTSILGLSGVANAQDKDRPPSKKFITPNGQPSTGLFSPGVMTGKTLYIAGKGDYRPDAPFAEKVDNCIAEVRKTLTAAGLDTANVVKSFVYLEDPGQYALFNERYAQVFKNNPPARTTLGVSQVPGDSRVEITCIAYSDASQIKAIDTLPPGLPFSPGVLAGDTLYVSGKGDQLPGGGHPATYEEQVRQAMRNVETTLKQAGLDFGNVVFSQVFVDKSADRSLTAKVYGECFKAGDEPALATVPVDWIPGGSHVEVTCIATTDLTRRKVVRPASLGGVSQASSAAVWAGDTLYISGLSGLTAADKDANLVAQTNQMARNHAAALEAAGLSFDDIVSGCVYLRDMADYQSMNTIYRQFYSRGHGVRTCLMPASVDATNPLVWGSFIATRPE